MIKPVHILLLEDNEGDILLTTEALKEGKIINVVSVVRDGWEATQFLEKKDTYENISLPDIILLDINMPKMNGHEVVKYIKSFVLIEEYLQDEMAAATINDEKSFKELNKFSKPFKFDVVY